LRIGEIVRIESLAESLPMTIANEEEFVASESAVLVRESESAVELGVVAE
jgi:hypothetical protein